MEPFSRRTCPPRWKWKFARSTRRASTPAKRFVATIRRRISPPCIHGGLNRANLERLRLNGPRLLCNPESSANIRWPKTPNGKLKSRIATVFPFGNTIVTLPGIHATQRMALSSICWRGSGWSRACDPLEPGRGSQRVAELGRPDHGGRHDPDPARPGQHGPCVSGRRVAASSWFRSTGCKFLLVRNEQVRAAIKQRGECWRISPLPKTPDEMKQMIAASRIAIRGDELYYYSKADGHAIPDL